MEIAKGELWFLTRTSKRLFVSKAKKHDRICLVDKLKSFMAATKCFHLATAGFFLSNNYNSVLLMGGRSRSNSVEEITPQVPCLGPWFAMFINLFSCDFQVVESFKVQVNAHELNLYFSMNDMYITINFISFSPFYTLVFTPGQG